MKSYFRSGIVASIVLWSAHFASAQPVVYGGAAGGNWGWYGPYPGAYPGPFFGPGVGRYGSFYPGWYGVPSQAGSFWTNGLSLYGPPVPTMGSVPGSFGGSDAHRQFFRNPPPASSVYIGIGSSPRLRPAEPLFIPIEPPSVRTIPDSPARSANGNCIVRLLVKLPEENADLWLNGKRIPGTGSERKIEIPADNNPITVELIARWRRDGSEKAESRSATATSGETLEIHFGS